MMDKYVIEVYKQAIPIVKVNFPETPCTHVVEQWMIILAPIEI